MCSFFRPPRAKLPVARIISLGGLCEVAYHVRRKSRSGRAYPFDWWDTPFAGLLVALDANPSEIFSPANIAKMPDARGCSNIFHSRLTHTIHQHEFARSSISSELDEAEISRRLVPKYEALRARLWSDCATGPTLFVRQRRANFDFEGEALEAALDRLHTLLSGFAADPRLLLLDYAPVAPRPWLIEAQVPRYRDCNDLGSRRGWNEVFQRHGIVCDSTSSRFGFDDLKETFIRRTRYPVLRSLRGIVSGAASRLKDG